MASDSFQRALDLVEVERPFEALPLLNAVIAAEPERVEAYRQRAKLRRRLKDHEGAIADYTKVLKLSPDAQTYLARALTWLSLDQARGAIADSREAIALKPELAGGHRLLGKALGLLGDGVGAIAAYKSAARCYLNDKDKKNAQACLEAIGPLQQLPPFKDTQAGAANAIDTKNAEVYKLRADMQEEMGATEGAIADYQRAATLWLNEGNWKKHQAVVESVRLLRNQSVTKGRAQSATVPIKSYKNHLPVVEVLFDGIATFDMVIDRNATHSIVTQQMANRLNLESVSYRYVYLADGTPMELSIGRLRSVGIGGTVVTDVYVAIAPNTATAVLGKDCFSIYSVRISGNEITFLHR